VRLNQWSPAHRCRDSACGRLLPRCAKDASPDAPWCPRPAGRSTHPRPGGRDFRSGGEPLHGSPRIRRGVRGSFRNPFRPDLFRGRSGPRLPDLARQGNISRAAGSDLRVGCHGQGVGNQPRGALQENEKVRHDRIQAGEGGRPSEAMTRSPDAAC